MADKKSITINEFSNILATATIVGFTEQVEPLGLLNAAGDEVAGATGYIGSRLQGAGVSATYYQGFKTREDEDEVELFEVDSWPESILKIDSIEFTVVDEDGNELDDDALLDLIKLKSAITKLDVDAVHRSKLKL